MHALDVRGSSAHREMLVARRKQPLGLREFGECFPVSRPAMSRLLRLLDEAGPVEPFWDVALERLTALAKDGGRRQ